MAKLKSPEESGPGKRPARRGRNNEYDGGGFTEGQYGRGPTPYKRSHSKAPASLEAHSGVSGRGGSGVIGKHDQFKGYSEDVKHPLSHAEFEGLGTDGGSSSGGRG